MRSLLSNRSTHAAAIAAIATAGLALTAHAGPQHQQHSRHHPTVQPPVANVEGNTPVVVETPPIDRTDGPVIQLALLLDTSNSMDGLINQAKTRLWSIVNELSRARHNGRTPQLQVALYEYGNDGIESADGHIRRRVAFTTDLDILSEQLFSLTTNGGSEYCGWVIDDAVRDLGWFATEFEPIRCGVGLEPESTLEEEAEEALVRGLKPDHAHDPAPPRCVVPLAPNQNVVRMVVIAGNEPFTQGSVHYRESVARAVDAGIVVNTIHCGSHEEGAATGWRDGAILGNGKYTSIDHNRSVVEVATPYDDQLLHLNARLNETYIPYGALGGVSQERQREQDLMNEVAGADVAAQRVASKSTAMYKNSGWDLVDGVNEGFVDLDDMKAEDLPEDLKGMSADELKVYVSDRNDERAKVQSEIGEISKQRAAFLAENQNADPAEAALHEAILTMLRDQCAAQGFTFDDESTPEE